MNGLLLNSLKTRRECLARPSKLTKSHSRASIQLSTCRKASYVAPVLCARIRSHAISRIRVIIIIFFLFFFSKPAISMQERVDRLILWRSVSRVGGGVHGHKAIVSFSFLVSTVDHGAPQGRQWMTPFSANSTCAESARASEAVAALWLLVHSADRRTLLLLPWGNTTGRQLQPVSTASPFYPSAGPASGVVAAVLLLLGCRFIHIHGCAIPRVWRG